MEKTDKQAISLLCAFACLMLASIVMPSYAAPVDAHTAADKVLSSADSFEQCAIGSNIITL
ncbi:MULTISPECIES: hypothetical protein [Pseudoalteromonas]|uniref:Uncharacterized protein n=1 Tax=Pseudoalteromonas prydzensis TaxID=182141 RepID=A0ABR9FM36_9GAMM|nr:MULTISPECIES: hypothetical protein [Pseudoalteromonas]MBE0376829.1 hypothetical protein [Pseudoalteromonas prydzensis ACAM 620]MBE0457852.1 hypothetical protein [Pseudoalteromonas prydzensis]WKD22155.1 hypothetical protein NDQ71_10705 [Pseudoalteromonas sp. KG3]